MTGIRVWSLSAFLACWLLIGCGDEVEAPSVNPVPGTPMEIAMQPHLSLGAASGDTIQEFYQLRTPFLLPGDRLAVPLEGSGEIRVFDLDGSFGSGDGQDDRKG